MGNEKEHFWQASESEELWKPFRMDGWMVGRKELGELGKARVKVDLLSST